MFGAQFARELWIESDDLDDRLATVATQLFDALRPGADGPAQTREARARGVPVTGAVSMNALIGDVTNRNRPRSGSVPIAA